MRPLYTPLFAGCAIALAVFPALADPFATLLRNDPPPAEAASEDLPEIDWSRVNIDAYDLTRPPSGRTSSPPSQITGDPVWSRVENRNGSENVTVKQALPVMRDANVGVDMIVAPSATSGTLPGAQQQASTGAAWASAALPSFGPSSGFWGWDQASINARLDPAADQGKIGTAISKSLPLTDQTSLTLQNGFGWAHTLTSPSPVPGAPSHVTDINRSAKISLAPTGTSFIAGSHLLSTDDRWLNSIGAEQSLVGGISVRGTISETVTGGHDRSLTAGFKRTW